MKEQKSDGGRRKFLKGFLTGAGVAAALGLTGKRAATARGKPAARDPILYRRTADVERYYKTLYT